VTCNRKAQKSVLDINECRQAYFVQLKMAKYIPENPSEIRYQGHFLVNMSGQVVGGRSGKTWKSASDNKE
jgi:regulator of sirC expression with transglutaminase-like and TPR domain